MAHAHVPRGVPRRVPRALAGAVRAGGRRARGGRVRAAPARRPPHRARQQRTPLHQLAAAVHIQVVAHVTLVYLQLTML